YIERFPKTFFASDKKQWVQTLIHYSKNIAKAVCDENKKVIVDSSKEITRALFLIRFVPNSKVIHLIRHPVSILQSDYYRLKNGKGFKFLRKRYYPKRFIAPFIILNCINWIIGNILCEIVRLYGKNQVLRVKYENLIEEPIKEIERIEKMTGLQLTTIKVRILNKEYFEIGHNIGGNQMRMAGTFLFDPKKSKRKGLPKKYIFIVYLICWPLLILYNYR
ncbi:MAG: sulfotransferase family protein, partial [bacterium]